MSLSWKISAVFFVMILFVSQAFAEIKETYDLLDAVTIQNYKYVWVNIETLPLAFEKKDSKKNRLNRMLYLN